MQRTTPYLFYEDVEAALDFLARAFSFQETLRYSGSAGYVAHAEMRLDEEAIMLGDPGEQYRNPSHTGAVTVAIHLTVDDVEATFERARAAGAQIIEPPTDQPYGGRRFGASDPEGHQWWFSQQSPALTSEDWGDEPAADGERGTHVDRQP